MLDTLKPRELLAVAASFFCAVAILCVIGAAGPAINSPTVQTLSAPCSKMAPCIAPLTYDLGALSQLNQATWLLAAMRRPAALTGEPLALDKPFTFYLEWRVTAVALNGVPMAGVDPNATHGAMVFCPPGQTECSPFFLFGRVLYGPSQFTLSLAFKDPLAAFRGEPRLSDGVTFEFRQGTVNEKYTSFEVATKVFFCVGSALIWAYYLYCLSRRDSATTLTPTQLWVAALGGLVFWFSDPLFLTYLIKPSLEIAAFTAFCSATYVALLLFFWLCLADNARLEAELGLRWRVDGNARMVGALYWVPKVLLCGVVWVLSIALYVFQRLSQLTDPTFTFSDSFGAAAVMWAQRFAVAFGALYLVYFLVLLVFAFRRFMALAASTRYLLAMSVAAIVVTMVGLFSQAFSATRSTAILFLVAQGGPTLYIWNLLLVLRPAPTPEDWTTADTTGALGSNHGADGVVIREAQEDAEAANAVTKEVRDGAARPCCMPALLKKTHPHPTQPRTSHHCRTGSGVPPRSSGSWLLRCRAGSRSAAAARCSTWGRVGGGARGSAFSPRAQQTPRRRCSRPGPRSRCTTRRRQSLATRRRAPRVARRPGKSAPLPAFGS